LLEYLRTAELAQPERGENARARSKSVFAPDLRLGRAGLDALSGDLRIQVLGGCCAAAG
jgi:hypothetical protein